MELWNLRAGCRTSRPSFFVTLLCMCLSKVVRWVGVFGGVGRIKSMVSEPSTSFRVPVSALHRRDRIFCPIIHTAAGTLEAKTISQSDRWIWFFQGINCFCY